MTQPMTQPSGGQITAATNALRKEAKVWAHQGQQIGTIPPVAEKLRLSRLEAGIFQIIVSAYNDVVDKVAARCREGEQHMAQIATTLVNVADIYDEEERRNEHRTRKLY
jgi:hypothetical protein